jgi:hypothetical protein
MALTMTRTKQLAMSLALAALVSSGTVYAQINPATAKAAAQNGAQAANASAAQSTSTAAKPSQTSATNPKNKSNTSATQSTSTNAKPSQTSAANSKNSTNPSATQSTSTSAAAKPQAQNKPAPAQTTKQPAKVAPPKDDKKKAPATSQAQKTPAAKDAKPAGNVTKTTKPELPHGRRDPFITLVGKQTGGGPAVNLPPGKGGLQVSTLILQGIVSGPNGMIAVVANPQRSVYFLRVGDELFDGRVDKIEIGSVQFHEVGKDAFGKPIEREVTRKLNPSSGDQP